MFSLLQLQLCRYTSPKTVKQSTNECYSQATMNSQKTRHVLQRPIACSLHLVDAFTVCAVLQCAMCGLHLCLHKCIFLAAGLTNMVIFAVAAPELEPTASPYTAHLSCMALVCLMHTTAQRYEACVTAALTGMIVIQVMDVRRGRQVLLLVQNKAEQVHSAVFGDDPKKAQRDQERDAQFLRYAHTCPQSC